MGLGDGEPHDADNASHTPDHDTGPTAGDAPAPGAGDAPAPGAGDAPTGRSGRAAWAARAAGARAAVRAAAATGAKEAIAARENLRQAARRGITGVTSALRAPARGQAVVRERARLLAAARSAAQREAAVRKEAARQAALREAALRDAARRSFAQHREVRRLVARDRARRARRRRIFVAVLLAPLLAATGAAVAAYFVDRIPTPAELALPESTTVYFADGTTPMARLGTENRTILAFAEMNDAVKQAIVAAEDRTFWTNSGIDMRGIARAVWNNATGGQTQGASTITQQYVRVAADLRGFSYARKAREAVLAWKIDRSHSKEQILEFYLNTVPFGRGAYGIEAAAQAFFGKSAKRAAPPDQQVSTAEAMLLAAQVKQPEPDPDDPAAHPGYDPARGGLAAANAASRWEYVRDGLVELGYVSTAEADRLQFPHVRALSGDIPQEQMQRPTGLIVAHVLSELRQSEPFRDEPRDYIRNAGLHIVTTVDKRVQDAAEAAADIRRPTAPEAVRGQPANWQAALVAVEPGTGRVLGYYGGSQGTGADYAGWYYDDNGQPTGYGEHAPGSSFKVYDLAEALRQGVSVLSHWDSPVVKEFPASGRTKSSPAGPVRNASTAACQPDCTLVEATVASLNVTFFDLTEHLGPGNVIDMARQAGIDSMWADVAGQPAPVRVDLRGREGKDLVAVGDTGTGPFSTEVGIGQYGVTVLDHANGMATFAAGGKRAPAHFVREVTRHGTRIYAEQLVQSDVGLTAEQVDELTWTLSQVPSAHLDNGWDAAGKTGTWQAGTSTNRNAHTWMVGYTRALAAAVWLGTTDGAPLTTKDGSTEVYGATHPAAIWRQFMVDASAALGLSPDAYRFRVPPTLATTLATPGPGPTPTSVPATPAATSR